MNPPVTQEPTHIPAVVTQAAITAQTVSHAPQPPASLYYSPSLISVNAMYTYAPPCSIVARECLINIKSGRYELPQSRCGAIASVFIDPSALNALKHIEYYSDDPELEAFLENVAAVAESLSWSDIQAFNAIKL
ncbi:hypothetical protein CBL_20061 [Carabus blaptoides fortunei]